ncbi:chromosome partition protein Smc-like isoform X2 [Prorops nasuta]|uniref:chromosome partition protein Smc-like isoform X2 n=1 Tax=Prorops nasuta TaxID=863751 RepID=UPI0034CF5B2E
MDPDIEKIHHVLIDAGLPSSINDLKNPTQEFMINLITTFLQYFGINVSAIIKPDVIQEDILTNPQDLDMISIMNLCRAMEYICNNIFIDNFTITDVIHPVPKKARKQAKFLANFILYHTTKMAEIEPRINEIFNRRKNLEEILQKKDDVTKAKSETELLLKKQKSIIDQLEENIKESKEIIQAYNGQILKLDTQIKIATEEQQAAKEHCIAYKAEFAKINKLIKELQSNVVKSPEEHRRKLQELQEQVKLKEEERDLLEKAILDRQSRIKKMEEILNFIYKQNELFPNVNEAFLQLKEKSQERGKILNQIEELKRTLAELEKKATMHETQCEPINLDEIKTQIEKRLLPLNQLHTDLLSQKSSLDNMLEEQQSHLHELISENNYMKSLIKDAEEEITTLAEIFQEEYYSEIKKESDLQDKFN